MFYKSELSFLCRVLNKNRFATDIIEKKRWKKEERKADALPFIDSADFCDIFSSFCAKKVYRLTDSFQRSFTFLLLPRAETPTVLAIGPYLSRAMTREDVLAIGESNSLPPAVLTRLYEYFLSLPVLEADGDIESVLWVFCERIWHGHPFSVIDITGSIQPQEAPFTKTMSAKSFNDTLVEIKALEKRYEFENEMMRTIRMGLPYGTDLETVTSRDYFEKRSTDSLRNAKNYAIIMNTIARKAAEEGGVHPLQINEVSSDFAFKIEGLTSPEEAVLLMGEMLRTYSRLVRTKSQSGYSKITKNAILLIDADLSANLSAGELARALDVSLGYFSTLFKRDTGSTVTEYITERRMEYAKYLLHSTPLQVQTIAMHCGITDLQYFSKIFKRYTKKSPTEFRSLDGRGLPTS